MRRTMKIGLTALLATTLSLAFTAPSRAQIAQPTLVSANPADTAPHVVDSDGVKGDVREIIQIGNVMYFGGVIPKVTSADGTKSYACKNFFSYNLTTGAISCFVSFDASVWALERSNDGQYLFVGGEFKTVNGVAQRGIAKINLATGKVMSAFKPVLNGTVFDLKFVRSQLLVGGDFSIVNKQSRAALVTLLPADGAITNVYPYHVSGNVDPAVSSKTKVYKIAVNPQATRAVIIGNFTQIGAIHRANAAMLTLSDGFFDLGGWYSGRLDLDCGGTTFGAYLRDVDFSPNGDYFVLVGTGGETSFPKLCDSASRWETNDNGNAIPTWIDYGPTDTLHSVAITGSAVYIGGHQKQVNNWRYVNDKFVASTPTDRPGIAALSPADGKALNWNPTRDRGEGARKLLATPTGLWIGSDTSKFGNEKHGKIAFCPLG